MSGYNKKTGLYELTASKAEWYCRMPNCPGRFTGMEFYAECLRSRGFNVVRVHDTWLEVDATQNQIFNCLSGRL